MLISKEQVFQGKVIVIMDEFEECDYITEFVLIALKDVFKVNQFLRLIIMTNAPDVSSLFGYFQYPKAKFDISIKTAFINGNKWYLFYLISRTNVTFRINFQLHRM